MEQGLGFVGPSVRLISYSKWSGNTFSGLPGTETNIIIQYFHCSGWGVREGPNIAKYGPHFWLLSPQEAPKWVQDPEMDPK